MRSPTRRVVLAVAAWMVIAGRADRATAGLITYAESAIVQGSLGQHGFNSLMTVSLTADTSGITQSANGLYHYTSRVTTATVAVDGLTATFLDQVYVVAGDNFAGFNDATGPGITIIDVSHPSFTNYNLATPLGPVIGTAGGFGGVFATTLGQLAIGVYGFNGTFTAAQAIPEPSSIALCGISGLVGLSLARVLARTRPMPDQSGNRYGSIATGRRSP